MMTGHYDVGLVVVSLIMAVLASYAALDLASRVSAARGRVAVWWLACGSVAMGIGIWSMHFIGMLAFRLPIAMGFDPTVTFLSLLIAIASSLFALWIVCQSHLSWPRLLTSALIMGAGVSAMHYIGMSSMRMAPGIHYNLPLFLLSVAIAVVASGAALWMAFHLRRGDRRVRLLRAAAAVVMGLAIAGMHYTGMAAARFPADSHCLTADSGVTTGWLALLITVFASAVLSIALITSVLDLRLEQRTALLADGLANAKEELRFLALHDGLTKLPNRALFTDRLEQEVEVARREQSRFSVLSLDVDGFRQINDAYGHSTGDQLLVEISKRLRGAVRNRDTVARLGGDEFVVLADAAEPGDAVNLAEKLLSVVREPVVIHGHEIRVSMSIGIAIYDGRDLQNGDVLRNSDTAMNHAMALGHNGYVFFEASMSDDAQKQLQLLQDLRQAAERHELVLHYQPKFNAADGVMIGAEALIRWRHPSRGLVPPGDFIPLAEKTGLIFPIGHWVLDEACRQMRAWRDAGHTEWAISVNLSALQFNHSGLIQMVRDVLNRYSLDPRYLTLEITESTAMHDADASLAILQQLHEMGVRISIDDFGTGYSSLLYLKRLPASELKIDRGFVRDLTHDAEDAAIIAAIVALGRTLNLKIVAEGVETLEQQEFLTRLGCSSLQGFLLGRPMPAEQFLQAVSTPGSSFGLGLLA
ncbi:MAG TPA: EAL domain-containing protein [Acidobacteriaceae bacterium]|jgi:diguanylate cyclase (GGDEF)-like protein|nr:EAL domain-containing protein [Acidobacteriaceae bacterium]